jgi:endonuclease G, mitochondrial
MLGPSCTSMKVLFLRLKLFASVSLICLSCWACRPLGLPSETFENNVHLLLGNPTPALMQQHSQAIFIDRPQYALLYDRRKHTAVWASWQLNRDWLGQLNRPAFAPDPLLSKERDLITPSLYTGSGFDRGHLVPAADRNRTPEDSAAVFYMSNIVPQAPDNNRGPWEGLESYCRSLAKSGKELHIIAGPLGRGGVGSKGRVESIAKGEIIVPANLWKIVVVIDRPGLGIAGVTATSRVIAVLMPNEQGIKEDDWRSFRTTVRDLEERTGYNFLSNVPQSVQDIVETQVDRL